MKRNLERKHLFRMMFLCIHNIWEVGKKWTLHLRLKFWAWVLHLLYLRLENDFPRFLSHIYQSFTYSTQCWENEGEEGWVAFSSNLCKLSLFCFSDDQGIAHPISFPSFAKKLLISLCKDVPFQVKCVACHQTLRSHMELTAHFRFVQV